MWPLPDVLPRLYASYEARYGDIYVPDYHQFPARVVWSETDMDGDTAART